MPTPSPEQFCHHHWGWAPGRKEFVKSTRWLCWTAVTVHIGSGANISTGADSRSIGLPVPRSIQTRLGTVSHYYYYRQVSRQVGEQMSFQIRSRTIDSRVENDSIPSNNSKGVKDSSLVMELCCAQMVSPWFCSSPSLLGQTTGAPSLHNGGGLLEWTSLLKWTVWVKE